MNPISLVSLLTLGIILPILALVVELTTHICAEAFFDPIPNPLAVLFVGMVPVANILALFVLNKNNSKWLALAGSLNGIAFCTSAFYALLFLPLMPIALFAIVFFGLGFLAMAPIFSFVAMFAVRKRLAALLHGQGRKLLPADLCISAFLIASATLALPSNLTRACESETAAHPQMLSKSLLLMRAFGNDETMLRACYGLEDLNFAWTEAPITLSRLFGIGLLRLPYSEVNFRVTNDLAREFYYRATGKHFNAVPRPKLVPGDRSRFYDDSEYYEYDQDFAGEAVGGVVRGLKLTSSRIGGEFDPDAAAEHLVWTMKFDKAGYDSRELRAQIMLPPGAVVSGAWLMVNGKRRDAVFQERHTARHGYETEARSGRSGLLIATAGPSRVLIQAPSVTGNLELCLQIDAPMRILGQDKVRIVLPALTERNFEFACKTDVNLGEILHSDNKVAVLNGAEKNERAKLWNSELFAGLSAFPAGKGKPSPVHLRNPGKNQFTVYDPLDSNNKVVQTIETHRLSADKPVVVVLDGSDSMSACMKPICDSLEKMSFKDLTLVWAADEPVVVVKHVRADSLGWKNSIARLRDSACVGGQDNAAALRMALQECVPDSGSNIVWVHGPQAIKLGNSNLSSLWKPRAKTSLLYEYQAVLGPNELIKSLDSSDGVQVVSHGRGIKGDLELLFSQLDGTSDVFTFERKFLARGESDQVDAPAFLVQLCANDLVRRELGQKGKEEANGKLAETYRIVTPLTSCVVLLDPPPVVATKGVCVRAPEGKYSASQKAANESSSGKPSSTSSTASASSTSSGSPAEPSLLVQKAGSLLIPTKPEPPLSLLMFCVLLVGSFMFWKKRVHKEKCL